MEVEGGWSWLLFGGVVMLITQVRHSFLFLTLGCAFCSSRQSDVLLCTYYNCNAVWYIDISLLYLLDIFLWVRMDLLHEEAV